MLFSLVKDNYSRYRKKVNGILETLRDCGKLGDGSQLIWSNGMVEKDVTSCELPVNPLRLATYDFSEIGIPQLLYLVC